jgi:flagellar biosynthesis/type III secretory pathway chaperone
MDASVQQIKEIYQKKITLFRELLHCVEQEKKNLMDLNTHNLWSLLQEKQKIMHSIEELGNPFVNHTPSHDIPRLDRRIISNLSATLSLIKNEIKVRVQENTLFIRESLDCIHDIISVFSTAGRAEETYYPKKTQRKHMPSLMYQSEV